MSQNGDFYIAHEEATPTEGVLLTKWSTIFGMKQGEINLSVGGIGHMFTADNDTRLMAQHQYPLIDRGSKGKIKVYDLVDYNNVELYTIENVQKDTLHVTPNRDKIVYIRTLPDSKNVRLIIQSVRDQNLLQEHANPPVGGVDARGVDAHIRVFYLDTCKIIAIFADPIENLLEKNKQTWPRLTQNGSYVVFFVVKKGLVQVGHIDSDHTIGRCYIHATPLSLGLRQNIVAIGADDGRRMLMEILDMSLKKGEAEKRVWFTSNLDLLFRNIIQ